ncbi:MFS transporter protein [Rutstroemia sp. NJR-2017a WRK4]|nr:MFS transporter protein [Rutstroemia sp. NJR-2017a WRK4]
MAAILGLLCNVTMFVMIKWGKELRKRSAETYWRWVDEARAKGLGLKLRCGLSEDGHHISKRAGDSKN